MPFYTHLQCVFCAFGGRDRELDWLITDLDCNTFPPELQPIGTDWLFEGSELSDFVFRQGPPVQFIWAVLSASRGTRLDLDHPR